VSEKNVGLSICSTPDVSGTFAVGEYNGSRIFLLATVPSFLVSYMVLALTTGAASASPTIIGLRLFEDMLDRRIKKESGSDVFL
jgi:hypothetical protein